MLFIKLAVLVFLAASQVKSQPVSTVPFDITSQPDCPVRLSGELTAALNQRHQGKYSYKKTLSATNVSNRNIVLLVIKGHIVEDRNFTDSTDYIYAADLLQPGGSEVFQSIVEPPGDTLPVDHAKGQVDENTPAAYIAFVQFADGSTWGDSTVGKPLLRDRGLQIDKLRSLAEVYRAKGEQIFIAELRASSVSPTISALKTLYEKSNGDASIVIKKLYDMLKQATPRLEALRHQSAD